MPIETVMIGVVSNCISHLFGKAYEKYVQKIQRDNEIMRLVEPIAKEFEILDRSDIDRIEIFIRSPEVESIITKIFSVEVNREKNGNKVEKIKQEFKILFHLHVNKEDLNRISESLFHAFFAMCLKLYEDDIRRGILYAHDKIEQLRFQSLKTTLESLQEDVEFLKTKDAPTIQQYLEFERKFKQTCAIKFESIRPPHLENAESIRLDELYVIPNFKSSLDLKGSEAELIKYNDLLSCIYRSVVLGDPGAGKTTLARKICYDFSQEFYKGRFSGKELTPILITLRDYGLKLESDGLSIIQFIEFLSNSWYQESPPSGAFEYLLRNGKAILIFDGLDELLDTSKRQPISDNLELFSKLYPLVPILITSRKVGYEQAPLDKESFSVFYISDFDDNQVEEYVNKWFTRYVGTLHEEKSNFVNAFLTESLNVKDLRSNPLILSLMCDIYRGEGYIPKNRPDVYEKCSELLLKKWDKIRGVSEGVVLDSHLKPTLGYIAYKIYSNEILLGGVTKRKLQDIAAEFLYPKYYESEDDANAQSERFIEFSRGRAWIFTETGAPGQGDSLYQFTHRTFLEYFTAYHLVRNFRTPEELYIFLLEKMIKREWDVVAQLAVQMQNGNIEDAGNEFLNFLLEEAEKSEIKVKFNLISFSIRSLEFIVPSPSIINKITTACIGLCIELHDYSKNNDLLLWEGITLDELINPLLISDKENIKQIRKSLMNEINKKINDNNDSAKSMFKILSSLPSFNIFYKIKGKEHLSPKIDLVHFQNEIVKENEEKLLDLCKDNRYLAVDGINTHIYSIENAIRDHGPGIIYSISAVYGTSPLLVATISDHIFHSYSEKINENAENINKILKEIDNLSQSLLQYPLPWEYSTSTCDYKLISPIFEELIILLQGNDLNNDTFFSLFSLVAPLIENDETQGLTELIKIDSILLEPIFFIFRARDSGYNEIEVNNSLDDIGFNDDQKILIKKWINKEKKFIDCVDKFDRLNKQTQRSIPCYPY